MTSRSDTEPAEQSAAPDPAMVVFDVARREHEEILIEAGVLGQSTAYRLELEIVDGQLYTLDERVVKVGQGG